MTPLTEDDLYAYFLNDSLWSSREEELRLEVEDIFGKVTDLILTSSDIDQVRFLISLGYRCTIKSISKWNDNNGN
jgi:hypothetical protein